MKKKYVLVILIITIMVIGISQLLYGSAIQFPYSGSIWVGGKGAKPISPSVIEAMNGGEPPNH